MICVLHIGSAKTATSSLQEILYTSRESLASRGWLYPTTGLWRGDRSHNTLGIYFWDDYFEQLKKFTFSEIVEQLFAEMEGWNNVIISSELMEKAVVHGNGNAQRLVGLLNERGYRTHVVYVVRRQDHYLDSQFKQAVADADLHYTGTGQEFIQRHAPALKYADTAAAWRALSGVERVSVQPFVEGHIHETFGRLFTTMGQPELASHDLPIPLVNPSLEGIYLRLKHRLNRFGLPTNLHHRFVSRMTLAAKARKDAEKLSLFSPDARHRLLSAFEDDLQSLNSQFAFGLAAWPDNAMPAPKEFAPLEDGELQCAMELISEIDLPLADEIRGHIAGLHTAG